MADSRFSSKFESGSLVLRVLFVCAIFLILLYNFYAYKNNYEIIVGSVFLIIFTLDAFIHHIESAKKERAAKEIIENELKIGYQIQKSLLPPQVPLFEGVDIAAGFLSAKEVAGDFYDLYERDGKLLIAIADAAGKGVSACLYSLCVRSFLRSFASASLDLAEIVKKTNELFCLDTKDSGVFVTAWVGLYDPLTSMLEYTCCGHCPPLLKKEGQALLELKTSGTALGVIEFDKVETATVPFRETDTLLLYTDGVREAHNASGKLFGKTRLLELFRESKAVGAQPLIDILLREVACFAAGAPQHDDLTLLVIRKTR